MISLRHTCTLCSHLQHPNKICKSYSGTGKCGQEGCIDSHPKQCKWDSSGEGCKRKQECEYLHNDNGEKLKCKCESCKYSWQDKNCVVEHVIGNMKVFFCLNCEDWVHNKANLFNEGWTRLDEAGYLWTDV